MERVHAKANAQLSMKVFSIDAGLAVDARLVWSVSTPMSREKIKQKKLVREQSKQNPEKRPVKFGRDLESDWTKSKDVPLN